MNAILDVLTTLAGAPTVIGLVLTALIIFLTSDWRLSLTALLIQYILIGVALMDSIRVEVALVKILAGVLTVSILYITARRIQDQTIPYISEQAGLRFLGMQLKLEAGPLGLPLRVLTVLLAILAVLRLFQNYDLPLVDAPTAFSAVWLATMGMIGLVLSGDPQRSALALLTILGGFDLVYARLETSLAIVGFWSALLLLAALAFAYLATVRSLQVISSNGPRRAVRLEEVATSSPLAESPAPGETELAQ